MGVGILRKSNSNSTPWSLTLTLLQVYNEKKQTRQKEIENVQFEGKKSTRKLNIAARFVLKEVR